MNFDDIVLSKTSQSQKSKNFMIHLYEVCRVVRSIGTKSRMVVASGVAEEEMGSCIELQLSKMNKFCRLVTQQCGYT